MEDASTGARASRDDEYDPSRETPLGRLMHLYRAATRRMEPGDEVGTVAHLCTHPQGLEVTESGSTLALPALQNVS